MKKRKFGREEVSPEIVAVLCWLYRHRYELKRKSDESDLFTGIIWLLASREYPLARLTKQDLDFIAREIWDVTYGKEGHWTYHKRRFVKKYMKDKGRAWENDAI